MAVSCTPADLAEAAKCYCYEPGEREKVKIYLLAVIAGLDNLTPKQLADAAACYCYDQTQGKAVNTYLLCQAANGGDGSCEALEGANSPEGAVTPDFIGQLYHETGDDTYWRSTGLTDADWVEITGASVADVVWGPNTTVLESLDSSAWNEDNSQTELSFPRVVTINQQVGFSGNADIEYIEFPLLETVGDSLLFDLCSALKTASFPELLTIFSWCDFSSCLELTSVDFGNLTSVGDKVDFESCILLETIVFPALVSVGGVTNFNDCGSLTSFSAPLLLPTNGQNLQFVNCSLTDTSVNHILARAVANAGYVTGTIDTSGGASAAPTGQGIVDKATLIGRGCTVNTN